MRRPLPSVRWICEVFQCVSLGIPISLFYQYEWYNKKTSHSAECRGVCEDIAIVIAIVSFFFFILRSRVSFSSLSVCCCQSNPRPPQDSLQPPAQATLSWEISSAVHRWPSPASATLIFGTARMGPLTILRLSRKHGQSKSRNNLLGST